MEKTYEGSCICRGVRYQTTLDLAAGTGRCNCSFCRKTRNWTAMTTPEKYRVTEGEALVGRYRPSEAVDAAYLFCARCGTRLGSRGHMAELGGDFVSVAIATLDVPPEELIGIPIRYSDGLNDRWHAEADEIRHL